MEIAKGKKILVIEDNEFFSELLTKYLFENGYNVRSTVTGGEGLMIYESFKPDLLIIDIFLPDMNGLDIIKSIRQQEKNLPIIVISGTDDVNIAVDAVKRGAWDYVLKPVKNITVFKDILNKAWEKVEESNREKNYLARLERHSLAAKKMQECLFPKQKVEFDNYVLSRHIIPSIDSSGDFVDYFKIDDQHFGFYFADVAGHGVAAAFLTVILKSTMTLYQKKYLLMKDDSILHPEKILAILNQEMLQENYRKHITIFYGVIDKIQNRFHYANAGIYPLPLLLCEDEKITIDHEGLPLGFVEDAGYKEKSLQLPKLFSMLFLSDGIIEILGDDNPETTKNKLLSFLRNLDTDESEILQKIELLIKDYGKPNIPDDISFLLIRKKS